MNYSGINYCDTANGPGLRVSLFVSGCSLHCKGCFNKEAWDPCYGKVYDEHTEEALLEALQKPYISGLSLLGGDPLEPYNERVLERLCARMKALCPEKTIWLWTGRKYEEVKDRPIMKYIDTIIDGPFINKYKLNEQDAKQSFKGSSNQRVYYLRMEL